MNVLNPATADVIRRAMQAARSGNLAQACEIGESALGSGSDGPLHAMVGLLRCRSGDLSGGIKHLRSAHEIQPDDLVITTNLTAALVESRDYDAALDVATPERAQADRSGALARFRGFAAQSAGRTSEAVEAYRAVVELQPRDWESWNNLGNALTTLRDHGGAIDALRKAHEINPQSAATSLNLARALILLREFEEAEAILRESIANDPGDAPALINLAPLLRARRLNHEAVALLARGVEANPSDPDLQVSYGLEASEAHQPEVARAAFQRALELAPAHGKAYVHLSQQLEYINREADIAGLIDRALTAGAPAGAVAYMRALEFKRSGQFKEGLEAVDQVGSAADPAAVEYLRGLFLERLGQHDAAFAAYQRMNAPAGNEVISPEDRGARYRGMIRRHLASLDSGWMIRWQDFQSSDGRSDPAFLVGFPRSGTTLLDTILMAHPKVEVMEEEPAIRDAGNALPEVARYPTLTDDQIQAGRDAYFRTAGGLTELKPGNSLVDKNPLAMNSLPLIYRLFPNARIILALRHPCDVVLSCFITNFKMNGGMANFVGLDTTAELYDLSFDYFERARKILPLSVHTVTYEKLVADRENELRALMEFLRLDWTPDVLDHQKAAAQREYIKTASYAQVVEPIYTRAAGRWEHYRNHLQPVLPVLEPWVRKFGYSL